MTKDLNATGYNVRENALNHYEYLKLVFLCNSINYNLYKETVELNMIVAISLGAVFGLPLLYCIFTYSYLFITGRRFKLFGSRVNPEEEIT